MAAPTLQAEGVDTVVTTGANAPAIPTHAADDIIVVAVFFWGPSPATVPDAIPTPSNYAAMGAQIPVTAGTTRGQIGCFWRRVSASGTTVSVSRGANWDTGTDTCFYARAYVIRGCITSGDPWDEVDPTIAFTSSDQAFNALTVSGSERLAIHFGLRTNAAGTPWGAAPGGWTAGTSDSNTGGTDGASQTYRQDNVSSSTSSASPTVAWSGSGGYGYVGVSFKPPAVGAVTVKQLSALGAG